MYKRSVKFAAAAIAVASPLMAGSYSASAQQTLSNQSFAVEGATIDGNTSQFNITGSTAAYNSATSTLTISIYTDYATTMTVNSSVSNPGAIPTVGKNVGSNGGTPYNTGIGDLFLTGGSSTIGSTPTYVAIAPFGAADGSTTSGAGYNWGTTGAIKTAFIGTATNPYQAAPVSAGCPGGGTVSPCDPGSGGVTFGAPASRSYVTPVQATVGTTKGTDSVYINSGSTDPTGGVGEIVFTLNGVTLTELGAQFTIEWAMTCGNYVLLDTFSTANTSLPTPLPAALPLFAGGMGCLGLLARRRKRKMADPKLVAA